MTCHVGAFLSSTVFLRDNFSSLVFCICAADVLNSAMAAPEMCEQLGPPQLHPLSGAICNCFLMMLNVSVRITFSMFTMQCSVMFFDFAS